MASGCCVMPWGQLSPRFHCPVTLVMPEVIHVQPESWCGLALPNPVFPFSSLHCSPPPPPPGLPPCFIVSSRYSSACACARLLVWGWAREAAALPTCDWPSYLATIGSHELPVDQGCRLVLGAAPSPDTGLTHPQVLRLFSADTSEPWVCLLWDVVLGPCVNMGVVPRAVPEWILIHRWGRGQDDQSGVGWGGGKCGLLLAP